MTIPKNVRAGVIGVGSLGQWHAEKYASLDNVELAGVYDSDIKRASEIADRYGCGAFDSMDAFAEAVDAASVVVPTDLHREVAGYLLERNVHLLVEKPIAASTAEAEALVSMAKAANLILQVGHVERFNPVLTAVESIASLPRFIEASRLAPFPPPREGAAPRGTEVSVVLDLMIHDLEVILHLVKSEVRDIRAVGLSVLSPSEDIANVRLAFENGCVANITASRISQERVRKIRLFYPDAYVSLDYQEQSGYVQTLSAAGIIREDLPIDKGDALTSQLRSFTDCVRQHGEPVVSGEHASRALHLAADIMHVLRSDPS